MAAGACRFGVLRGTVQVYANTMQRQEHRYRAGVISQLDLVEATSQLQAAQAQLTNVDLQRATLEHAIAVLIGKAPASFAVPPQKQLSLNLPDASVALLSMMQERRPDVAAVERRMAAANAQIGVAEAAFFPSLSLSANGGYNGSNLNDVFNVPN